MSLGRLMLALSLCVSVFAGGARVARAQAQREHRVQTGQNLARIARRYAVSVRSLAAANRLSADAPLQPGQVLLVPDDGVIYVGPGQTLSRIARMHDVSQSELARANRLSETAALRIGQRLVLPGYRASAAAARATGPQQRGWGPPRVAGVATVYRLSTHERMRLRLVDPQGRARRGAIRMLGGLMRSMQSRRGGRDPHPRLVRLIARVSDHFGGRQVDVVSGYRPAGGRTREGSRHTMGHAIDFRIPGVPLHVIRDYCRAFDHVGVGYYPTSQFVHMDVRRDRAFWIDTSGPGERARYRRPGEPVVLDEEVISRGTTATSAPAPTEPDEASEPIAPDDGQAPIDDAPNAVVE